MDIKELGVGVYRSNDGMRQFRIDNGSLTGAHRQGVPHVHLELFRSDGKQMVNNHIPFED
jgi:filamentous hemagglutinin